MVIGIRDNSDVSGHGYILPPHQPEANNEALRRRCLKIVELQEKLKMEANRTTRYYNHLKSYVESSVEDIRSSMTEIVKPGGSKAISIASIVGGAVITGFVLMSTNSKLNTMLSADPLFRNTDLLKGLCIAAGATLMIGGVVYNYSSSNWRKYTLQWRLKEISNRRRKYFESLFGAYSLAEDLKSKSTDALYSEIFVEFFPLDSAEFRIASEMFNMTSQTSEFILNNSQSSRRNATAPVLNYQNIEMICELVTQIQQDMDRVDVTKNALINLHSYQ